MKISEILTKAKARIEDPEHWCQGANARDANGYVRAPWNHDAVCFCLQGALMAETSPSFGHAWTRERAWMYLQHGAADARRAITGDDRDAKSGVFSPLFVNDSMGHTDTMRMWDYAIGRAKADETAPV